MAALVSWCGAAPRPPVLGALRTPPPGSSILPDSGGFCRK